MLCLEEAKSTFVNGNGIVTGTKTLRSKNRIYHRINTANNVSRRGYEIEIGDGERICRMAVVANFPCWS